MRIALLYDALGRSQGGVEAWMYHAAETLDAMGHLANVIATSPAVMPEDAVPAHMTAVSVNVDRGLRIPGLGHRRLRHALARELREICAMTDMFWARSYMMALAACDVADGRPVLFVQATPYPLYVALFGDKSGRPRGVLEKVKEICRFRVTSKYERLAMARCSLIVHLSQSRQDGILAYYGEEFRKKCRVVPPGVNVERFVPGGRQWDGKAALYTVSVCRLGPEKNLQCVVRAAAILKRRGIPVQSIVVGDGPLRGSLEELARVEDVTDRVHFVGRQADVEWFYQGADVFVLPSTYEGFGSVYLEALACGLPCVAIRNIPGKIEVAADEIIEPYRTGLLMEDDSPELLADALAYMYHHPDDLRAWSKNARRSAETRFDWKRTVQRLLELGGRLPREGTPAGQDGLQTCC